MSFVVLNSQALSWTEMEKNLVDRLTGNYPDIDKFPCKFQVSYYTKKHKRISTFCFILYSVVCERFSNY